MAHRANAAGRLRAVTAASIVVVAACGGGGAAPETTAATIAATSTSAPATTTTPETTTTSAPVATTGNGGGPGGSGGGNQLEAGRYIWEEYYLGEGCQKCHGLDARGTADGPDIRGASRTKIVDALLDVEEMQWEVELKSSEIDAVHAYLEYLSALPEG